MTIPSWPADLPVWVTDGYGYTPVDPCARTQMDAGNRRVRRRFITTPTDLTLKAIFTRAQMASFETWWQNSALAGSAWVMLPISNGQGLNNVQCRFSGTYQAAPAGDTTLLYEVSVSAETLSMPVANG